MIFITQNLCDLNFDYFLRHEIFFALFLFIFDLKVVKLIYVSKLKY